MRRGTAADLTRIHALIESAYRGDSARQGWTHEADLLGGQRTDLAALTAALAEPDQYILVMEIDGAIVATVHVEAKDRDTAYLGQLAVSPVQQANGLGRRMIEAAEAVAVDRFGARIMEMTVITQRLDLIAYYVRRGYAPTGELRPFPVDDARFGIPVTRDLSFTVLAKTLRQATFSSGCGR